MKNIGMKAGGRDKPGRRWRRIGPALGVSAALLGACPAVAAEVFVGAGAEAGTDGAASEPLGDTSAALFTEKRELTEAAGPVLSPKSTESAGAAVATEGPDSPESQSLDRSGRARLVLGATLYGLNASWAITAIAEPESPRTLAGAALLGMGVGAGTALLATRRGRMTRGQAWTIITGMDYGSYSGLLLAGVLGFEDERSYVLTGLATSALSIAGGAWIAEHANPSHGDAELARSGALWGSVSGLLLAGATSESGRGTTGLVLGGMVGGLGLGALQASRLEVSASRVLWSDVGALAGLTAGFCLPLLFGGESLDARAYTLTSLVGMHLGFLGGFALSEELEHQASSSHSKQAHVAALLQCDGEGRWGAGRLSLKPVIPIRAPEMTKAGLAALEGAWVPLVGGVW